MAGELLRYEITRLKGMSQRQADTSRRLVRSSYIGRGVAMIG